MWKYVKRHLRYDCILFGSLVVFVFVPCVWLCLVDRPDEAEDVIFPPHTSEKKKQHVLPGFIPSCCCCCFPIVSFFFLLGCVVQFSHRVLFCQSELAGYWFQLVIVRLVVAPFGTNQDKDEDFFDNPAGGIRWPIWIWFIDNGSSADFTVGLQQPTGVRRKPALGFLVIGHVVVVVSSATLSIFSWS